MDLAGKLHFEICFVRGEKIFKNSFFFEKNKWTHDEKNFQTTEGFLRRESEE